MWRRCHCFRRSRGARGINHNSPISRLSIIPSSPTMFQLSIIKDTVPIHPSDFGVPAQEAIITELNKKYANRVLHNVGLGICVFDLSQASEGKVRYGDGMLWYKGP